MSPGDKIKQTEDESEYHGGVFQIRGEQEQAPA